MEARYINFLVSPIWLPSLMKYAIRVLGGLQYTDDTWVDQKIIPIAANVSFMYRCFIGEKPPLYQSNNCRPDILCDLHLSFDWDHVVGYLYCYRRHFAGFLFRSFWTFRISLFQFRHPDHSWLGDVAPLSIFVRRLAVFEAAMGSIHKAEIIAMIVGRYM